MQQAARNARAGERGWNGEELARDPSQWLSVFTHADLAEIDTALRKFRASGKPVVEMTRVDFPLDSLAGKLAAHLHEIRNGRGFVLLRGLPVERYSDDDAGAIFFGLGLYLGHPLVQNPMGDVLGHVYDQGRPYGQLDVRGYETNALLPFHTDGCEIVGLLCLRKAKRGGLSSISSSVAVFHELQKTHPEYLAPLFEGYRYIRREAALTEDPVSKAISVFGVKEGCRELPAGAHPAD